jgi:hypothetical protein
VDAGAGPGVDAGVGSATGAGVYVCPSDNDEAIVRTKASKERTIVLAFFILAFHGRLRLKDSIRF